MICYNSLRKNDLVALFITMTSFRNIFLSSWKVLLEFKRKNSKPPSSIAQEHIRETSQRRKEKAIDFQSAIWKTIKHMITGDLGSRERVRERIRKPRVPEYNCSTQKKKDMKEKSHLG